LKATGKTRILGILGHPIGHTLSPEMQNAALASLGLDFLYIPFDVIPERMDDALRGLVALGAAGFNVTIPHKEAIIPLLDQISDEVRRIGAVNTVEIQGTKLIGHNTDGKGFLRVLEEEGGFDPSKKRILILGAGGSARAVAVQLALSEATEIRIVNRTPDRARGLGDALRREFPSLAVRGMPIPTGPTEWQFAVEGADLLVNTTPVGLEGGEGGMLVPADAISPELLVFDLVYRPAETPLLKAACFRGARTLSGLSMLLQQGAISFEIWTGRPAPREVMRAALSEAIRS